MCLFVFQTERNTVRLQYATSASSNEVRLWSATDPVEPFVSSVSQYVALNDVVAADEADDAALVCRPPRSRQRRRVDIGRIYFPSAVSFFCDSSRNASRATTIETRTHELRRAQDDVCVSGSRDFFVSVYDLKDFRRRATFDFEGAVSVLSLSHDKKHVHGV